MPEVLNIFLENLFGFDWIILFLAAINICVFLITSVRCNKIYEHFNTQDYICNLNPESKKQIKATAKKEKKTLSAYDLLKIREKMNKGYALYINLTTMFPLLGMLGTVVSLIPLVTSMGSENSGLFFSALTSTFWGIVAALVFKFFDSSISYKIEDNEKHMEYIFNPQRKNFRENAE